MSAIVPLVPLSNRRLRRGYEKERKKVEHLLVNIECEFEFALFNAPKSISYEDLYKYFLDEWHKITDVLNEQYKFIYIAIDKWHFPRMYKAQI